MTRRRYWSAVGGLMGLMVLAAQPAWTAPIPFGNISGTTVDFQNVAADAVFGVPVPNGDSLEFSPVLFLSSSAGGSSGSTPGTLTFDILAHPGLTIDSISLSESGFFQLLGNGTFATTAQVLAQVQITIDEVDGAPITPVTNPLSVSSQLNLIANEGKGPWSVGLTGNLDGILNFLGVPFVSGATHASITVTNTLSTASEATSVAEIDKQAFAISAETSPLESVPEPGTAGLCALGVAAILAYRRRRRP